jgi:hypothetical protein
MPSLKIWSALSSVHTQHINHSLRVCIVDDSDILLSQLKGIP